MDYVESAPQVVACTTPALRVDDDAYADQKSKYATDDAYAFSAHDAFADTPSHLNTQWDAFAPPRVDAPARERVLVVVLAAVSAIATAVVALAAMLVMFRARRIHAGLEGDPYDCGSA
jgi:hypothetical protein